MPHAGRRGIVALLIGASVGPLYGESEKTRPLEVEPEDLRPGLVAHYRSLTDKEASLYRIDAKPAFRLDHSSPHPRIPSGPFEVVWTGMLNVVDPAPVTFDAFVCGEITVKVDGAVVLQGRGESETAQVHARGPLNRPRGLYRLRIRYRSLAGQPARLQIGWEGRTFSREPLPAWHMKCLLAPSPPVLSKRADPIRRWRLPKASKEEKKPLTATPEMWRHDFNVSELLAHWKRAATFW